MGHVPIIPSWSLTLAQQARPLERRLRWRYRNERGRLTWRGWLMWWRRRAAHRACVALIEIREHDLFGAPDLRHAGVCALGTSVCGPKPPSPPPRYRAATWDLPRPPDTSDTGKPTAR